MCQPAGIHGLTFNSEDRLFVGTTCLTPIGILAGVARTVKGEIFVSSDLAGALYWITTTKIGL